MSWTLAGVPQWTSAGLPDRRRKPPRYDAQFSTTNAKRQAPAHHRPMISCGYVNPILGLVWKDSQRPEQACLLAGDSGSTSQGPYIDLMRTESEHLSLVYLSEAETGLHAYPLTRRAARCPHQHRFAYTAGIDLRYKTVNCVHNNDTPTTCVNPP